jgi:hypothetical protein
MLRTAPYRDRNSPSEASRRLGVYALGVKGLHGVRPLEVATVHGRVDPFQ